MPTFALIQAVTVSGSSTDTVQFNNIPQTFTDLILYVSAKSQFSSDSDTINLRYNSIASYSGNRFYADGGSLVDNSYTSGIPIQIIGSSISGSSNQFSSNRVQIYDYTNSTNVKSAISWGGYTFNVGGTTYAKNGWSYVKPSAGQSSAPITSLTLTNASGSNFVANSTFYLYGIKNA